MYQARQFITLCSKCINGEATLQMLSIIDCAVVSGLIVVACTYVRSSSCTCFEERDNGVLKHFQVRRSLDEMFAK
jgi:hypothetical protein